MDGQPTPPPGALGPPETPATGPARRWWRRPAVVVGLAVGVVVLVVASVLTGLGIRSAVADPATGMLRIAHLSPSTPSVDMYASGADLPPTKIASSVSYRGLTPYFTEPAGTYTLQARPAGASPDSAPALSVTVEVPAGTAQTASYVDAGANRPPELEVLNDETALAAPGSAAVRVVQGAANLGPLDVQAVGGPRFAQTLFYGSATPYVTLPARPFRMDLRTGMGATGKVAAPLTSGSVSSLVVTREPDGELVGELVADAASAVPTPGPGAPALSPTPTPAQTPDPETPLPAAPKAPQAPRGGIGAGLGGLAPRGVLDGWFDDEPQEPSAPRLPVVAPLEAPAGPRPAGISAPTIGLGVPSVVDLRVDYRGALQVPTDYGQVGWYTGSALPGDPGPAVLAGHVDTRRGPAVFAQLDRLRPGDPIDVPRSDGGTATYKVDSVEYYPKDNIPTERIYGPSASPQLRLLTCGGPFDDSTLSYRDNLVVFASQR